MKIKYILEDIGLKGLRDRSEKEFVGQVTLGRGSSCGILLVSRIVSFNHAKVSIVDGKLYLNELEGQPGSTLINNQAVSKGPLVKGDVLRIGDVVLNIDFDGDVWSLIEFRSAKEQIDTKKEIEAQVDLLTVVKRVPSKFVWTLAIVIPILVFLVAAPLMGLNEPIWESGPLTKSHKFLQSDCRSCHEKNFEVVADSSCRKCHDIGDHVDFLTKHSEFNERCSTCHREHINEESLVLSKSDLCLSCHANIKEIKPSTKYPAINGFNQTHPDFKLISSKKVDRAKLKLNHKYHLLSIEVEDKGTGKKRLMGCQDCHVPDANGEYMDPINFDKYCFSCHKLKMSGAAHMLQIPHVKTSLVRTFLKGPEDFLYEYIDSKPEDLMEAAKSSGGGRGRGRRSKGPPPAPVQKPKFDWVQGSIEKIERRGGLLGNENDIYFSAQGGCVECHEMNVRPVGDIDSEGSLVAVSLWEHEIRLWDARNNRDEAILRGHQDIVNSIYFNKDGTRLVTGARDFTARVWDMPKDMAVSSVVTEEGNDEDLELEPSGSEVSSDVPLEEESSPEIKNPVIQEASFVFKGHKGAVNDAVFSPSQDRILTGAEDGLTIVWDIGTQRPIHKLKEYEAPVKKVRFNSDGSLAVALTSEFNVTIWQVSSGELETVIKSRNQEIIDVEFSPTESSKIAVSYSGGSIRIYDLDKKDGMKKFSAGNGPMDKVSGHSLEVTSIAYSLDGAKLASVSRDFSAKIWDIQSGKVISTLAVIDVKSKKLKDQRFVSIAFSGDGRKAITGSTDKIVRYWDVYTGELIKELLGHENVVSLARLAKNSESALTVSDENYAVLWDLASGSKKGFRHGESEEIKAQILTAQSSNGEENSGEELRKANLTRLPKTLPTNVPSNFFTKGFFNHRKHEYLKCDGCHYQAKNSVLTSDLLLPSIKLCRTCHEKEGVQLNRCIVCHIYHPKDQRNFTKGLLAPDKAAKLGYSYLKKTTVK
jgi:predicted CXXCH cytochrome family protein